ncbi:protein kinase [Alloacidobacterium dinghuense]|uniref:non-specific serine/threonine protein kinase n=1 Tax=Alloacidobacterium dinghuense TaxID=2763107 RepID=A0A7G8BML5_9BACT|nr:serine/threonine-protein kinase [Alloacidobacterium dinghuense]QNI33785.1 protein kinase [Alloacidobacterium dinghuense]
MALEVGQRVGDYEVLALLGSGGMGRVYKVRNIISNREEAMKILLPDYASEPELAARFMSEIRTLAGLEHPNIAQLRTAFQFQNQLVMIMEFVEGATLEALASQTRIPPDRALDFSTQVLSALSYAHGRGVTHRDIKPANIMITSHGLVKLTDFGIAKSANDMQLTRPGTTMGSVYYMSPEQVRGGTVDQRSDLYSFGVTLYEMLTGRKPFQADTSYSVLNAQLNEAPKPPVEINPALSPELNNIVLRAMVKNPDGRFRTADEFRDAIKSVQGKAAAGQQPAQPVEQQQGFAPVSMSAPAGLGANSSAKSHRGLWIGLGAVAAILALVAAATLLPHLFKTNASPKAAAVTDTQTANPPPDTSTAQPTTPAVDTAQQPNPLNTATPQPSTPTSTSASPAVTSPAHPVVTAAKPHQTPIASTQPAATAPAVPAPPTGPSAQEVRDAHDRYANLEARADAARSGVQQLRSQQQAQGFDIRGDILGSLNRMNSSMSEANRALGQNDLQAANDYMDRADKEVSTLEKFLNIK